MWLHRSWLKVIPSHPRSPTVEVWKMSIMMRVTSQKLTKGHPKSSKVTQGRSMENVYYDACDLWYNGYLLQSASIMLSSTRKTERYTDIQTDKMTGGRTEWLTERDGWGKQSQARNGVFSVHWPARTGDLLVLTKIERSSSSILAFLHLFLNSFIIRQSCRLAEPRNNCENWTENPLAHDCVFLRWRYIGLCSFKGQSSNASRWSRNEK